MIKIKDNKLLIVKALVEKGDQKINIRQLSQELSINYSNVYYSIKQLQNEGLISLEKMGNSYNCILNKKVHPLIFQAEYGRRDTFIKDKNIKALKSKLNSLKFPFIALIFGSYAKGNRTKGSDLDLMTISEKNRIKDLERIISLLPLNIHMVPLTFEEFSSMAQTKKFNVVLEVMAANVILIGIEDYYRMLENVE